MRIKFFQPNFDFFIVLTFVYKFLPHQTADSQSLLLLEECSISSLRLEIPTPQHDLYFVTFSRVFFFILLRLQFLTRRQQRLSLKFLFLLSSPLFKANVIYSPGKIKGEIVLCRERAESEEQPKLAESWL